MNRAYLALAERIRGEAPDLARLVQRTTERWKTGQKTPSEQDVYLESAALNLHGFYFRHLVRNVYTFHLVPEKMKPLVADLPGLWDQLRAELLAFADFLEALAEADAPDQA